MPQARKLMARHKLTLLIASASTIAVLLATVVAAYYGVARSRHAMLNEVSGEAQVIAGCLGSVVSGREQQQARELLGLLRKHPDILSARILAWGGSFAEYSSPGATLPPASLPPGSPERRFEHDQVFLYEPITSVGQPIGTLLLRARLPSWRDQLLGRTSVLLVLLLSSLLVALVLTALLDRIIARLCLDLTRLVQAVTAQKDYSLRAPRSEDQIGLLSNAFNQMLAQIQQDMQDRKQLQKQLLEISDREQDRIGRDLHDGLCQLLAAIAFSGSALRGDLEKRALPEAAAAELMVHRLNQAIASARHLARGLYPVKLQSQGLAAALVALAAQTRQLFGLDCVVECDEGVHIQDQAVGTHLYRIAQEAVHNAVKHARAKRVLIRLASQNGQIHLMVADDGIGIPQGAAPGGGMGLTIMKYRAEMIGGTLQIRPASAPAPMGTVISCHFPQTGV